MDTTPDKRDPWGDDGAAIPHVITFANLLNNVTKTYSSRRDEAIRAAPSNALAMRRDCYIRSLLQERAMPTVNRKWEFVGEDPTDPEQQECAKVHTAMWESIPRKRRLLKYLMEAAWYGVYGSQVVWRKRNILGEQRYCVVSHKPVNGDKIQFAWDGIPSVFINLAAASQYPKEAITYTDRVPSLKLVKQSWRQQFIIHSHEVEDADYFEGEMAGSVFGFGLRSMMYWSWWLRDEMLSWAVDIMKKVGTLGLLIFPYEMGSHQGKEQAEENAKAASVETAITIPVELKSGAGKDALRPQHIQGNPAGIEVLCRMITDYFERHQERLVVGQSMSSGQDSQGSLGGTGRAELAEDTKCELVKYDAENLGETLTEDYLAVAHQMNFPDAKFKMTMRLVVPESTPEKKLEAVSKASSMGVTFIEQEVRALTGMSEPTPDDKVVGGQQPGAEPGDDSGDGPDNNDKQDADSQPPDVVDIPSIYAADNDGHWITIGAVNHKGGSPVYVKDGRIAKGHRSLVGRKIQALKPDKKEHTAAAEKHGVDQERVNQLAGEIHAHGNASAADGHAEPVDKDEAFKHAQEALAPASKDEAYEEAARHILADHVTKTAHASIDAQKHLSDEQKKSYKEAYSKVIDTMPHQAVRAVANGAKSFDWSADKAELGKKMAALSGTALPEGAVVQGFYLPEETKLYLNGEGKVRATAFSERGQSSTHQTYAHELGHAIDFGAAEKGVQLSKTPGWQDAWKSEVAADGSGSVSLSRYAEKSVEEGFAEFARMMYGNEAYTTGGSYQGHDVRELVAARFPKCLAFFKSKGLID